MANIQIQFRRDPAATWTANNPKLAEGEMGIETDTFLFKIGDGILFWNSLAYGGIQGPAGSTTTHAGTATIDFGAAPGTNITTATVSGQTGILSTTNISLEMSGMDSTVDHNTVEHQIIPMNLVCSAIVVGTSFTILASTEFRLTGTFKVRWTWLS